MGERLTHSTGTRFERDFGYVRAVRHGPFVSVSGTVADDDGEVVAPGDHYEQAVFCLERIEQSLLELGASLEDVIHTRVYLLDFDTWEPVGRAHREVFEETPPANTTIQVSGFVEDEMVVEIDAQAFLP